MRVIRTMMVLIIALSVALLPTVASAASVIHSASQDASMSMSADMTMSFDMLAAMDDCCPDSSKAKSGGQPCHQGPMACCVGAVFSLADTAAFRLDSPVAVARLLPLPEDQVTSPQSGNPPFRPPRV